MQSLHAAEMEKMQADLKMLADAAQKGAGEEGVGISSEQAARILKCLIGARARSDIAVCGRAGKGKSRPLDSKQPSTVPHKQRYTLNACSLDPKQG